VYISSTYNQLFVFELQKNIKKMDKFKRSIVLSFQVLALKIQILMNF